MAEFAWTNYKKYAWGENELKPVSRSGHDAAFGDRKLGSTIVDSLDALYIMNLKEQYQEGRDWVAQNFSLKDKVTMDFRLVKSNSYQMTDHLFKDWIHICFRNKYSIHGWFSNHVYTHQRSNV